MSAPLSRPEMTSLALSFPELERHHPPGIEPWDPEALDAWAAAGTAGSGALAAAQFVLAVWNEGASWTCGSFAVTRALGTWDESHRNAFLAWAQQPWWP